MISAFLIIGCNEKQKSDPNDLSGKTVLNLKSVDGKVAVEFTPTNMENLPRIIDIYLKYDSSKLTYIGNEKGDALKAAEKDVFVKADKIKQTIRITSLSAANLNRIAEGTIVILEFRKTGEQEAEISFDKEKQVFAPAEANNQVSFGNGITL